MTLAVAITLILLFAIAYSIVEFMSSLLKILTMLISEKIFPCWSKEIYETQWEPVFGIFYSLWLRKKYGHKKGYYFDYETRQFMK
jgi:hypothetical protein